MRSERFALRTPPPPAIYPIRFDVSVWSRMKATFVPFARLSEGDLRKLRTDHPDWEIRSAPIDIVHV